MGANDAELLELKHDDCARDWAYGGGRETPRNVSAGRRRADPPGRARRQRDPVSVVASSCPETSADQNDVLLTG